MGITIGSIKAFGNGQGGVSIDGDCNVSIGAIESFDNAGEGVAIRSAASILAKLGIPDDFNPESLGEIIKKITPQSSNDQVEGLIRDSYPNEKILASGANISTIASNLIDIVSNPLILSSFTQMLKAITN